MKNNLLKFLAYLAVVVLFNRCENNTPETFLITYSIEAPGEGLGGTVSVKLGEKNAKSVSLRGGEVTANPDNNYLFAGWSDITDSSDQNPRYFNEKGSANPADRVKYIRAEFKKDLVRVITSIGQQNAGSITIDKEPEDTQNNYFRNDRIEVTAVPAAGWKFTNWLYQQDNNDGNVKNQEFEDNPITVDLDYDTNQIIAYFEREVYDLSVNIAGEGRVLEQQIISNARYESASSVRVEAMPIEGWEFVRWSGDLTSENPSEVIVMDGPKEITAIFNNLEGTQSGVSFNYSDKSNCDENGCDVELNLTVFNGHSESIEVTRIEVFVNENLYETITTGNVITTFAPGDFHTSKIEFEDASSALIKVYFDYSGDTYISEYNWLSN